MNNELWHPSDAKNSSTTNNEGTQHAITHQAHQQPSTNGLALPELISVPNPALLCDLGSSLRTDEKRARELRESGKAPGPVTGFTQLDNKMGGFLPPGLNGLIAAPGAGKTALALQISSQCGFPCLYVTSEMGCKELLRRYIARETKTYLNRLRGGELTDVELKELIETTNRASPMIALLDAVNEETSCPDIEKAAHRLRNRFASEHVMVIIDSVTDLAVAIAGGKSEYEATEAILQDLKKVAANLDAPIIMISHRNRAGQKAEGNDRLFTSKGTGRFEYMSNTMWDLERDSQSAADVNGQVKVKLSLLKNRFGERGSIDLLFEGRIQKFTDPMTSPHTSTHGAGLWSQ